MIPILGEPGSTHEGDLARLHRLLAVAADAGCTAYKPQWCSDPEQLAARRRAPDFLASYRTLAYPVLWHAELARAARDRGLQYVVSIYLPEDAQAVAPYVDALKLAAFEHRDLALLKAASATGRPMLVSTGMGDKASVLAASAYASVLLHGVSRYPAPLDSLNLGAIATMQRWVGIPVGWSDHSADVRVGGWAVSAGAALLEIHMRLDDCAPENLDYAVSLPPAALAEYVRQARDAETARGDGVKAIQPAERSMLVYQAKP